MRSARVCGPRWSGQATATAYLSGRPSMGSEPATRLRQPVPPPGDGTKGHYWYGNGAFGITAIKKASEERVKEILRIMNYLAAPIGSEEYLLLHYGVRGIDWEFDDRGNPTLKERGVADAMPWGAGTVTVPN